MPPDDGQGLEPSVTRVAIARHPARLCDSRSGLNPLKSRSLPKLAAVPEGEGRYPCRQLATQVRCGGRNPTRTARIRRSGEKDLPRRLGVGPPGT